MNQPRAWMAAAAALVISGFALILVVVMVTADSQPACGDPTGASGPGYAPSANALADIPGNYLTIYQQAAQRYSLGGDGWAWLAGFGKIETNHGRLNAPGVTSGTNFAGAAGPMQFLLSTWAQYKTDGNGDGRTDVYDPRDAIPGAAKYLKASGAPGDWGQAAFAYNRAGWYVDDVRAAMQRYRGAAQANPTNLSVVATTPSRRAGGAPRAELATAAASPTSAPTRPAGSVIATAADHQKRPLGNWQSDNAIDVGVPRGSDALAVAEGTVLRTSGSAPTEGGGVIGGYSLTLKTSDNQYFYTHLQRVNVRAGQRVRAGDVLGETGFANGVDHLHIGMQTGDPSTLTGGSAASSSTPVGGCDAGGAVGPANLSTATLLKQPQTFTSVPTWAMAGARSPAQVDSRALPDLLWLLRTYNMRITAGRETGHASHGDGTGVDLVPADTAQGLQSWQQSTERAARDIGWTSACGAVGVVPACPLKPWVRFVGYNGYPSHGDPRFAGGNAHLHISWKGTTPPTAGLAPASPGLYVFPTPGGTTDVSQNGSSATSTTRGS